MISEWVIVQVNLFGLAILWGMGILLVYDILRIIRRVIKHNKLMTYVEDILFWIAEAFLIYHLMYRYDNGAIRSYTMFGMIVGMILYSLTVSRFFVKIISKILNTALNILLTPIKFLFKTLNRFFRLIQAKIKKILKYCVKLLKKRQKAVTMEDNNIENK